MKKQKWSKKPFTWGDYLWLCGVCGVIGMVTTAYYWIKLFEFHPIRDIRNAICMHFNTETHEE